MTRQDLSAGIVFPSPAPVAALAPVYRMIFPRFQRSRFDWAYEETKEQEKNMAELRESLENAYREAIEEALKGHR